MQELTPGAEKTIPRLLSHINPRILSLCRHHGIAVYESV